MFKFAEGAPFGAMTSGRRRDRATDELIGICRGILADGSTNDSEARFLLDWISRNEEFVEDEPFRSIYDRLADALQDGVLDSDEERDLIATLLATVGGEARGKQGVLSQSSSLPLCNPAPTVQFPGAIFVVTGTFSYGSRREVAHAIEARSGTFTNTITQKTRYLVIGNLGSRDWIHSAFGRKIQDAMHRRDASQNLGIICENHWALHL